MVCRVLFVCGAIFSLGALYPASAHAEKKFTRFVGSGGNTVLTNQPQKYRHNSDYDEVEIHFEPIAVHSRYNFGSGVTSYSRKEINGIVYRFSKYYNVEAALIFAIIQAESSGNPYAVSKAGARGLMQLMPGTAAEMRVSNIYDPAQNIAGGVQYLSKLTELFNGDLEKVIAAYNAGPGAVKKHGGIPPFPETRKYVKRVKQLAQKYGGSEATWNFDSEASEKKPDYLPEAAAHTVIYTNGTTQPADSVQLASEHYLLEYEGRRFRVPKSLIESIKPAL